MEQTDPNLNSNGLAGSRRRKTPRKSRSKGLRTKTGCITCRQRHKKCKEAFPVCGNCSLANRACIWPDQDTVITAPQPRLRSRSRRGLNLELGLGNGSTTSLDNGSGCQVTGAEEEATDINHVSPSSTIVSEFLTTDFASIRWLDLLAEDAFQANRGFTRPSSPTFERQPGTFPNVVTAANNVRSENGNVLDESSPSAVVAPNRQCWRSDQDILLKDSEIMIFRNFVEHAALWLDLFDPKRHFSVYTTRLALRNIGLMKAILALSAHHLSRQDYRDSTQTVGDPNAAIQYYYETLHYVQYVPSTYKWKEKMLIIIPY